MSLLPANTEKRYMYIVCIGCKSRGVFLSLLVRVSNRGRGGGGVGQSSAALVTVEPGALLVCCLEPYYYFATERGALKTFVVQHGAPFCRKRELFALSGTLIQFTLTCIFLLTSLCVFGLQSIRNLSARITFQWK